MIGMMTWTPPAGGVRQKSVALETRALLHLRVAWASVARGPRTPEALVRRRVLTAAKRLRKAGVTRLVVPEAFAYGEQLEKVGVAPVSTLPLRRALAADLARAVMAGRNLSGGSARASAALSCWPYWWRAASCGRGRSPWARRRADTAENFAKPQAASLDILKSTHYNTTL